MLKCNSLLHFAILDHQESCKIVPKPGTSQTGRMCLTSQTWRKCLTAEHSYKDRSRSGSTTLHVGICVMICTIHEWAHQGQRKVTTMLTWVRLPDRHQSERIMFGLQVHWHWLRQDCDTAPSGDRTFQTAWHLTNDAYLLVRRLCLDVEACCSHPQQLLEK